MPQATLAITLPEGPWITAVSRNHPDAHIRVLSAMPADSGGVGLLEITAPDLPAIVADMDTHEGITELTILHTAEDTATVQFTTSQPRLLTTMQAADLPFEPPLDIQDGTARLEVTGSSERLSALRENLDAFGFEFRVERVGRDDGEDAVLTDRQRRVLLAAVERGYYDSPRQCTLTELAEALDIAKSTCSEILHRAEGEIIRQYVDRLAPSDRGQNDP